MVSKPTFIDRLLGRSTRERSNQEGSRRGASGTSRAQRSAKGRPKPTVGGEQANRLKADAFASKTDAGEATAPLADGTENPNPFAGDPQMDPSNLRESDAALDTPSHVDVEDPAAEDLEPIDPKEFRSLFEKQQPKSRLGDALDEEPITLDESAPQETPEPEPEPEIVALDEPSSRIGREAPLPVIEKRPSKIKPASKEDVLHKIREGFRGLNTVLSGIDEKLQVHNDKSEEIVDSVRVLPSMMENLPQTSKEGVELLSSISTALEAQTTVNKTIAGKVEQLSEQVLRIPAAVDRLAERLDRQDANTDRLDRSIQNVQSAVVDLQQANASTHRETLEHFQRSQDADREQMRIGLQADRDDIRQMMLRTSRQGQVMTVVMVLLILSFIALMVKL